MKWMSGDSDNMIDINKTYLIQMTGTGQEKDKKVKISLDILLYVRYNHYMMKMINGNTKESI